MKKIISAVFVIVFAVLFVLFPCAEEIPVINEMPTSVTVSVGEAVTLSCVVAEPTDRALVRYEWYRAPSPSDEGEAMTAAQFAGTYQPNTDFPGEFYYYCVAYYIYEETSTYAKSDVVTVTVEGSVNIEKPVIITDLKPSYSVPQGGELIISVECEEPAEPISVSYQWYSKLPSEKVFNKVSGVKENSLKVSSDSIGTTQYMCMISASYGDSSINTQSAITRVEVYSHEHTYGEWTLVVSPTCSSQGEEQRVCECGAVEKSFIDPVDHIYGEWVTTVKPTSNSYGEEERKCSECGDTETRALSPVTTTEAESTEAPKETETTAAESDTTEGAEDITTDVNEEKYQIKNVFPWWNVILIFGIVSTIASAAAAVYFLRQSGSIKKASPKRESQGLKNKKQ